MKKPKRPQDVNQRAKFIVELATGEASEDHKVDAKKRKGGLKGGKARAKKLSAEERSEIAKRAAKKMWGK